MAIVTITSAVDPSDPRSIHCRGRASPEKKKSRAAPREKIFEVLYAFGRLIVDLVKCFDLVKFMAIPSDLSISFSRAKFDKEVDFEIRLAMDPVE